MKQDSSKAQTSQQFCQRLLNNLQWRWDNPRVIRWLSRVGVALRGSPYSITEAIPDKVYVSLGKFLDLRYKCDRTLMLLHWDWNHPEVKKIERLYNCENELPLKGYQQLYKLLDEMWFVESGGF